MQFGLFSESGHRGNPTAIPTYDADLREIILCDELGFQEVWVAERGSRTRTDLPNKDIVTAANLLICTAAARTKRIRLGTGIRPLPYQHPFNVATEANVCDVLTGGRYMLGYGGTHGFYGDHNVQLGIVGERQRPMTYEAIDYILKCFTQDEPFDFEGEFYHGNGIYVLPRPLQKPHVPLAAACSGNPETLALAARNGFMALLGRGGDPAPRVREMGDIYVREAMAAGRPGSRREFRVTKHVYVSSSVKQATDELKDMLIPWLENRINGQHWEQLARWVPEDGTLDDITYDYVIKSGYYVAGDPDTVAEALTDFYHASGGFGVLLLFGGQGHVTQEQFERSLRLFAEQVAPRLAGLDPDRDVAAAHAMA